MLLIYFKAFQNNILSSLAFNSYSFYLIIMKTDPNTQKDEFPSMKTNEVIHPRVFWDMDPKFTVRCDPVAFLA